MNLHSSLALTLSFEDVKPSDVEKEDYKDFSNILKESRTKMTTISEYGGCSREIQEVCRPASSLHY